MFRLLSVTGVTMLLTLLGSGDADGSVRFEVHFEPLHDDLVVNGDFETGDFTGWTLVAPPDRVCDAAVIGGEARFQLTVCELFQSVDLLAGNFDICADIGAFDGGIGGFGGTFELLFDGQIVDMVSFGQLMRRESRFDSLSASLLDITSGSHEIRIRVDSGGPCCVGCACDFVPSQFLDNVTVVPEPSAALLHASTLVVLAALAVGRRRSSTR